MLRNIPQAITLLLCCSLTISACGGDDEGGSGGDTDGGDPPADNPDPEGQVCDEPGTMG